MVRLGIDVYVQMMPKNKQLENRYQIDHFKKNDLWGESVGYGRFIINQTQLLQSLRCTDGIEKLMVWDML
jgi:hypothetical protein